MPPIALPVNNHSHRAMVLIGLYTLLPFLILSFYNQPSVDDFEYAVRDNKSNFLATQIDTYLNWSGRYFATAISRINPIRFGSIVGYKISSFLLLLLFVQALYFLVAKLFNGFTFIQKISLTAFITILYITQMPDIPRGLFYMTAYLVYQVPNILSMVFILLLVKLFSLKNKSSRIVYTVAIGVINLAIIGLNELSLVYLITTLAFLVFQLWKQKHSLFYYIMFVFVISLAAALIMVLAPGNYVRMSYHTHDSGNIIWSVLASIILIVTYFYKWGILLLIASLLYMVLWHKHISNSVGRHSIFKVPLWLSLLYYFMTLFLMNFVFTWSIGAVPKTSVENIIYFFFILGWFYNLQVALTKFSDNFKQINSNPIINSALLILFVRLVFDINNNISTAYLDLLSGKAATFNQEHNTRNHFLKTSGCRLCLVNPLTAFPKSLYTHDVTHKLDEKDRLINSAPRKYWGKDGIFLANPSLIKEGSNLNTLHSIGRRLKHSILGQPK